MTKSRWLRSALASLLLALAMASAGVAAPRGEHFNETFHFTEPPPGEPGLDNPCTPQFDDITLDITDRVQGFEWTENGVFYADVHVSGHANGVAADGTVYEGKLNDKFFESRSGTGEDATITSEFQAIMRLISHGTAPNFIVQEWGTFTLPPPNVTFDRQRTLCRG